MLAYTVIETNSTRLTAQQHSYYSVNKFLGLETFSWKEFAWHEYFFSLLEAPKVQNQKTTHIHKKQTEDVDGPSET